MCPQNGYRAKITTAESDELPAHSRSSVCPPTVPGGDMLFSSGKMNNFACVPLAPKTKCASLCSYDNSKQFDNSTLFYFSGPSFSCQFACNVYIVVNMNVCVTITLR